MTSGELLIRNAEEPFALSSPTRITGTNTDGALSEVAFSTPPVHFVQEVTDPAPATAEIDATFTQLTPGTGSVNENGDVIVQVSLAVALHLVVDLLDQPRDCRAAPINLTLTSTTPYDPETQRVTLRASNFSIPAVPVTGSPTQDPFCDGLVTDAVNTVLQGTGHTLTLALEGPLTLPTLGEPTATTLAVTPASPVRVGTETTLTATITPDPAVPGAPAISGQVAFFDDGQPVGIADVQGDGTATLATTGLLAGARQLTARYLGAPPDWDPSSSAVVPYTVHADPALSTDLSGVLRRGAAPKPFDVTMTNTGFGRDLDDVRMRVTVERAAGFGPLGPDAGSPRIVLRHIVDGTPSAVALTPSGSTLTGLVGDGDPWDLAPGEEVVATLDLQASTAMSPGPLRLTFTLEEAGGPPVALGTTVGQILVTGDRIATTITAGDPGFPPIFPAVPPVTPVVARQGGTLEIYNLFVNPDILGVQATGTLRFAVDGRPVPVRSVDKAVFAPSLQIGATNTYVLQLPSDVATGVRQVEVRYSGDALFAPSLETWPVTIRPATGSVYECVTQGVFQVSFTASVEVDATLPTVWATGRDIDLTGMGIDLRSSRTYHDQDAFIEVVNPSFDATLQADLGPGGAVSFTGVTQQANAPMFEDDGLGPDRTFSLTGGSGSVPFEAAPGSSTDITLDRIEATVVNGTGFTTGIVCSPLGTPHLLGSITAAGTTLVVEPGDVVAEGHETVLTATVLPATPGFVEFRDGPATIGVVPAGANGVARMVTDDLPTGVRSLTARFFGGAMSTLPSPAVELRVATCGAAAGEGSGAVVRLVYLELLGRCPDAAGYAFWVGRLDGGTTPEAFARSIARTPEAVGRVVDDAYRTMLGRPADASGRAFWTRRLQASGRYDQLLADLAASGEFWSKSGASNGGAVTRIYERLLDRSPDQGGFDFWVGRLDDGVSRRALVLTLANLAEPLGVLVDDAYDEILDRKPTATERTEGITYLRSTGDRSGLYAHLIGTQEFHDRAQGLPDPV